MSLNSQALSWASLSTGGEDAQGNRRRSTKLFFFFKPGLISQERGERGLAA